MRDAKIAVLGASGLIGAELAGRLMADGFFVVPVARRFTPAQRHAFGAEAVACPILGLDDAALARLFLGVDVVVNCIGVLQDGGGPTTEDVHIGFAERLLRVMDASPAPILLVQISVPGEAAADATAFSRTKRAAERIIAASGVPHVILRPGFVVAPSAYGGSALLRALAMLPVALPAREAGSPFAVTAVADIARTVAVVARRWKAGERLWQERWDVMEVSPSTVGTVVDAFRARFGGPRPCLTLPSWLMALGSGAGDLASHLGWRPPIRSTALMEMRRGVAGDPGPWMAATGIVPLSAARALAEVPATVQEKWFARLYLAKGLMVLSLALFWVFSGLIALTVAFDAATRILLAHDFPPVLAKTITAFTSLCDIAVGIAIAVAATCRRGLLAGIGVSLFYMLGAAVLTPEMWIEPLGALVKTGPAIVLMLVTLAILDDR